MKLAKRILLFSAILLLAACQKENNVLDISASNAEFIPRENPVQIPTVQIFALPQLDPNSVAFDFSDRICKAAWSNNGEYLPCPGNLDDQTGGYANRLDSFKMNGNRQVEVVAILTIPAQAESTFGGIFGKYPPYSVQMGDRFLAKLACQEGFPSCDAQFSLEYYTSDNRVEQVSGAEWNVRYDSDGGYISADVSLDELAGRTFQFLLVVRDNGNPEDDHGLWIQPHIQRNASVDAPTQQEEVTIIETVTVSGTVDMSSAPPYLYDDHPPGTPVAVVLSNAGAPHWYWVSTAGTHPDFTLEVVPGSYYVHAYAPGIGEVPYVTGAYTGKDPSCGEALQYITALPGAPVEGILINDWGFTCESTAERFDKPEHIPLP
jgi:hypothetical protein